MELSRMGRLALTTAVIFVLAGCGGATVPLGATTQSQAHRASSSSGDLLYVSDHANTDILMLTYPQGKPVGTIDPPDLVWNLCSDSSGNVWVPSEEAVYEYAHGGTNIVQTLDASGLFMSACAVDPTTGNLAIVGEGHYGIPTLAIWANAQGTPTTYTLPFTLWSTSYDDSGNLFIDGYSDSQPFEFAELPKGSSTVTNITLDQPARHPGNVEWDGKYIAVDAVNPTNAKGHTHVVYRVQISGSVGHVAQTVVLYHDNAVLGSSIEGNTIVGVQKKVHGVLGAVGFWKYPQGRRPFREVSGFTEAWGVTVSVAPSGPRIHN
jgi:hypothetical protein